MGYQNEQKRLTEKWMTSTVVLTNMVKEVTNGSVVQTNRFATAVLDILVMKLLEVQKGSFTKDSYDLFQEAILKAIESKTVEVANVYNNLITATGNLQTKKSNEAQQYKMNSMPNEVRTQNATSVLQKTLQAVIFNVNQFPFNQMTKKSVEQVTQSLQLAVEVDQEKVTSDELIGAFKAILQSLLDVQLIKGNSVKTAYNA